LDLLMKFPPFKRMAIEKAGQKPGSGIDVDG
jgi:hypothetical protein